jgi:hypothetical protein
MEILTFFGSLFGKTDNIAIIVLSAGLAASLYLHIIWRREEAKDRQALLDLLIKNTDAINGLKQVLSVMTGKIV